MCARIATEFRQLFHKDVVIDMFCYRRFGHNENDEPTFTQPLMYKAIKDHPTTLQLYATKLVDEGTLTQAEADEMIGAFNARLDEEFDASKSHLPNRADWLDGRWSGLAVAPAEGDRRGETAVPLETLKSVGHALTTVPDGFHLHTRPSRASSKPRRRCSRPAKASTGRPPKRSPSARCWSKAFRCACRGQDSTEGTFSQRHAALIDQETEERYLPLNHIRDGQAPFEVIDSLLSEEAVLGFEYGYSSAEPKALVLWEAQFGDFANGAQVIIDQFIASGEMKWLRMCGLVMLLPHGYEGQGPEHSSARLERYLQLCAQDNIQVAYCTTPANYFHVLRRQMHRPFRKPLILMTPKSLLRHKRCTSFLADFGPGSSFHRVLRDQAEVVPGATTVKLAEDSADQARRPVQRQGLFRPDGRAREAQRKPHPDPAHRTALSVPGKCAGAGAQPLPQGRARLVPGRAEEPGRLALRRAAHRGHGRPAGRREAPALCRPARICLDGRGPDEPAQCRTESVPRRGFDAITKLR